MSKAARHFGSVRVCYPTLKPREVWKSVQWKRVVVLLCPSSLFCQIPGVVQCLCLLAWYDLHYSNVAYA